MRIPLRSLIVWLVSAPVLLLSMLLAWLLAPFLFVPMSFVFGPVLPWPFRLFHAQTKEGLDGGQVELGWPKPKNFIGLYKQRVAWMWRNPSSGIGEALGYPLSQVIFVKGRHPRDGEAGSYFAILETPNGTRFFVWRFNFKTFPGRWAKCWFGWQHNIAAGRSRHKLRCDLPWPFRRVP